MRLSNILPTVGNRQGRGSENTGSNSPIINGSTSSSSLSNSTDHTNNHSHHSRRRNHQSDNQVQIYQREIPPASERAIQSLVPLRLRALDKNYEECTICSENFKINCVVGKLPCGHMFHIRCIDEWISRRCTCPVCRYELPTDDVEFEKERLARKKGAYQGYAGTSVGDEEEEIFSGFSYRKSQYEVPENFNIILTRVLRSREKLNLGLESSSCSSSGEETEDDGDDENNTKFFCDVPYFVFDIRGEPIKR